MMRPEAKARSTQLLAFWSSLSPVTGRVRVHLRIPPETERVSEDHSLSF